MSCKGFIGSTIQPFGTSWQVVCISILLFVISTVVPDIPTKESNVSVIVCAHKTSEG